MMDRERLGCWARGIAIGLAVMFVGSFVFFGIGSLASYNLFELVFGSDQDQQQAGQTVGLDEQIQSARQEVEENPEDPEAITTLAALYYQDNRLEEAEEVLVQGREVAPENEDIAMLLGQVYFRQAQTAPEDDREELYAEAGDAFAAAAEIEPENEDAHLAAGEAYEQAGQPSEAIKHWNVYLDLEPEGEQAEAVEERISALLEGGQTTGEAEGEDAQP